MHRDSTRKSITTLFNRLTGGKARAITRAFVIAAAVVISPSKQAGEIFKPPEPANSGTQYSQTIADLQKRFGTGGGDSRIILFDEDWFHQNMAMAEAEQDAYNNTNRTIGAGDEEEEDDYDLYDSDLSDTYLPMTLLELFAEERAGADLSPHRFYNLVDKAGRDHGTTMMSRKPKPRHDGTQEPGLCFIFPHRTDIDAEFQARLMIGLDPMRHGELADLKLRGGFAQELTNKYSDYHEIGHCLDRWFSPQTEKTNFDIAPEAYLHSRHQAEMFGDVFATLMLAKDGYTDIALRRADERLASAAIRGADLATGRHTGDRFHYAGYIYAVHDGLRAVQKVLDGMTRQQIADMSVEDALQIAHSVVRQNSLDIETGMAANMHVLMHDYDINGLPAGSARHAHAMRFVADMEQAVRNVLDVGHLGVPLLPAVQSVAKGAAPKATVKKAGKSHKRYMTVNELAAQLLINAGGNSATREALITSIADFKDSQRALMTSGTGKQSRRAMVNLSMMRASMKTAFTAVITGQTAEFIAYHAPPPEARPDRKPVYARPGA